MNNEEQVSPSGDLNAMEWKNPPEMDSLGAPVGAQRAFRVKTREELARVLEAAREERVLVRPAGALTSSKAFVNPPKAFMEEQKKNGVWVVSFSPEGEFGQISLDLDREEVTVGAAVSLAQMDEAVRERSKNGNHRARLANLMKITTMDALAVATALGSGGVSDAGHSSVTTMTGSHWMDGRGVVHRENYKTGDYFDSASSSFARVNHRKVGVEMSGRGAPFGIGLSARFTLGEAPLSTHTFVYPFFGSPEKVRAELAQFTVEMNQLAARLEAEQSPIQVAAMELMDKCALNVAAEGTGSRPFSFSEDPAMVVIVDFDQFDCFGDTACAWSVSDAVEKALDLGLVPESFMEHVAPINEGKRRDVNTFRLQGPEHIRSILKRRKAEFPHVGSESTDWAVDPCDENLVQWYLGHFFKIHDAVQKDTHVQALYGHLFRRLDLHHRVIVDDPTALKRHIVRATTFGHEIAERQKNGERVRVRGEKVELPFGRDLENIGKLREGPHMDSNRRLLRRVDPDGLFKDRAPERWGGKYHY